MILEILQILIPAVLIVGGGGIAYWRFLQEQENNKRIYNTERQQEMRDYKLEAERMAWDNNINTIKYLQEEVQLLRVKNQEKRQLIEEIYIELRQKNRKIEELQSK